jgi:hypothetical protein
MMKGKRMSNIPIISIEIIGNNGKNIYLLPLLYGDSHDHLKKNIS